MDNKGNHGFYVELKSKEYLKSISISDIGWEGVLIEGFLGELEELFMLDGLVLQMRGTQGILTVDLIED